MADAAKIGVREQKRLETARRITEAGIKLFTLRGFDATTLDDIAAEAGISRRTFFHYFKSKDDILLSMQASMGEQLVAALARRDPGHSPLRAVREAGLRAVAAYPLEQLVVIDRLMMSSETIQARKQASYIAEEAIVFAGLKECWPDEPEIRLRLLAILSIGAARASLDSWRREGGIRPLSDYLIQMFDALTALTEEGRPAQTNM